MNYKIGPYRGGYCVHWFDTEKIRRRHKLRSLSDEARSIEALNIYKDETSSFKKPVAAVNVPPTPQAPNAKPSDLPYIIECLDYDADTGKLTWKERPQKHFKSGAECKKWNARYSGKRAGFSSGDYISVRILRKNWQAHRFAWAIHHGSDPKVILDHINGDGKDNRICNLREVSHTQNSQNTKKYKTNTSGFIGVSWHKTAQKWCAYIGSAGKIIQLGAFETKEQAAEARAAAEIRYSFHPNHGREAC